MHKEILSYRILVFKIDVLLSHIDVLSAIFLRVYVLLRRGTFLIILIIELMREFSLGDGEGLLLDGLWMVLFFPFGLLLLIKQQGACDFRQVEGEMQIFEGLFLDILQHWLLIAA